MVVAACPVVAYSMLATHGGSSLWHSSDGRVLRRHEEVREEALRVWHGTEKVVAATARHEDA
jgi:hypothetical protein